MLGGGGRCGGEKRWRRQFRLRRVVGGHGGRLCVLFRLGGEEANVGAVGVCERELG